MPKTWEVRDYDREFFAKELEALYPSRFSMLMHTFMTWLIGVLRTPSRKARRLFRLRNSGGKWNGSSLGGRPPASSLVWA